MTEETNDRVEQLGLKDQFILGVKLESTLENAIKWATETFKMADLEVIAGEVGVEKPANTKPPLIEQIIAKVTSGEDANVDDEAEADSGVQSDPGVVEGVSLPAKVAKYRPDQLWPQILGWEIDQGLDEVARAAYTEDECREYLAYLWQCAALGTHPTAWAKITDYEFRGIREETRDTEVL